MAARFLVIVFLGLVCLARAQNIEIPIGEHCVYTPVDAFFVMDGSASVGSAGWEQATNFMSSVIEPFDIGTDNLQVGLVRYSSDAKVMFNLNRYQNKDELLQAIKDMQWFGGVTNTGDGLLKMRDAIMDPNLGSRQGTRKVAFVITDGRSNTGPPVVDVAPTVHALGITVVAIGVGDAVLAELETIAYPSSNVLYVSDFGGLARIRSNLTQVICHVDAGWGQWTPWSLCDRTCGEAIQVRTRLCDSPPPSGEGSKTCQGPYEEIRPCNLQPCIVPINGNWGQWLSWGACSASCGPGQQFRSRLCDNPAPQNGGLSCPGPANEGRDCFIAPCITDGNWGGWGAWTLCSATCGLGEQNRFRECNNPPPSPGGASCPGSNVDTTSCTVGSCPVDGGYGAWSVWTPCSAPCGPGIQTRGRSCDSPAPAFGGRPCVGPNYEETVCNLGACSINGNWGQWTEFSTCSAPCGPGEQTRTRACDSPAPAFGGLTCPGPSTESISCNLGACSINGNWGQWTDYSACSAPCGPGEQTRTRACDSPAPAFGGLTCPGPSTESISCNLGACSINGNWGQWTEFSACSAPCGPGEQTRTRACDSPAPLFGGLTCPGPSAESIACNLGNCAVNGNWGQWTEFGACSRTCGPGEQRRTRACDSPPPAFGGADCPGFSAEVTSCSLGSCAIDGNWGEWTDFSFCSTLCGPGEQRRTRLCNNPAPLYGGARCPGPAREVIVCNLGFCPVNGNWGPWTEYSTCSTSCGTGEQRRTRTCDSPPAQYGGAPCQGPSVELLVCNLGNCPINGNWGQWNSWSACSAQCGPGERRRVRACNSPAPAFGGLTCPGPDLEIGACNLGPCAIDGNWGAWAAWTGCDAECGPGRKSRGRICNAPAPSFGGRPCEGPAIDYTDCMNKACLVIVDGNWNVWNGWTACTKSCGGGATVRARHCNAPGPQNGGKDCQGPQVDILSCNENPCPVNGNWGPWCCGWGSCSASCGGGVQSRTRQCAMPAPAHGGLPCEGPNVETQACNVFPCLVPTGWGEWGQWSRCSASCGPGIQGRRRQCVNPLLPCVGSDTETAACNLGPCVRPCRETTHVSTSACSSITGNGVSMYSYLYTVPNVYLNCQGGSVYIVNACSTFGISEYCSPLPSVSKLLQTSCNGKSACVIKRPCDMVLSGTLKINYRCTC